VVAAPAYPETSLTVVRSEDFLEEVSEHTAVDTKVENKSNVKDKETEVRFKFLSLTHK
jgi:phage head maturation protease